MQKDFDEWNKIKQIIHCNDEVKLYHTRELWWASLGVNVGSEQDGSGENYDRPVLILKGLSKQTCIILPLTSSSEKHKMRVQIGMVQGKKASVIISQIRVIDTKRLVYKIGFLDKDIFDKITKTIKNLF
ncbi:MAG: type II toxin-antitoxin system PemK/MazF family toxin [Candidatus Parcubacteria bacterium]|nr:type II toxin-antitoxin system PemK/MazF family toxin [Candidatus Parcubacteria bacterium]